MDNINDHDPKNKIIKNPLKVNQQTSIPTTMPTIEVAYHYLFQISFQNNALFWKEHLCQQTFKPKLYVINQNPHATKYLT